MKKIPMILIATTSLFASDPITIDSLFKQQIGLRSVTSLLFMSTGNSSVYTSHPSLMINGDPVVWNDTKQLSLSQTLMYALSPKLDIITSFSWSYRCSEYLDYYTLEPKSQSRTNFDSVWVGFNYRADQIGELIPMLTIQTAVFQLVHYLSVLMLEIYYLKLLVGQ